MDLISSDALGNVYKAEHLLLGIMVELREFVPAHCAVLSPDSYMLTALPGMDAAVMAAYNDFLANVRLCSGLQHAALPRVQTAFSGPTGTVYAVLEYKETQPLLQAVAADTADEKSVSAMLKQILSVLSYLQKKQLLPNELTPECIAVADGKIQMSLFGSLRKASAPVAAGGTPGYASMEQLQRRHAGPVSVVYSLGAVLYQLISGEIPLAAARRIGKTDPYEPLAGRPALAERYSEYFLSTIDKALKLWPEDRWHDYAAWLAGLTPPKQGATVSGNRTAPWQQGAAAGSIKTGGGGLRLGGSGGAVSGGGLRLGGGASPAQGLAKPAGLGGAMGMGGGMALGGAAPSQGLAKPAGLGGAMGMGAGMALGGAAPAQAQAVAKPAGLGGAMGMGSGMALGGAAPAQGLGKPAPALGAATRPSLGTATGLSLGSASGIALGSASPAVTPPPAEYEEDDEDSIVAKAMASSAAAQALGEANVRAITDFYINYGYYPEYDPDWFDGWQQYDCRVEAYEACGIEYGRLYEAVCERFRKNLSPGESLDDYEDKIQDRIMEDAEEELRRKYYVVDADDSCLLKKKEEDDDSGDNKSESADDELDRLLAEYGLDDDNNDDDDADDEDGKSVYKGTLCRIVEHKGCEPGYLLTQMGLSYDTQLLFMSVVYDDPGPWGSGVELVQIYMKRPGEEWEYVCTPKYAKDCDPYYPTKDWQKILDLVWDWNKVNYETVVDDNLDIVSEKYSVGE